MIIPYIYSTCYLKDKSATVSQSTPSDMSIYILSTPNTASKKQETLSTDFQRLGYTVTMSDIKFNN